MLDTILFDMGGTLEDIWYNEETSVAVTAALMDTMRKHALEPGCDAAAFWEALSGGVKRYKRWSEETALELKPEVIWPDYYLAALSLNRTKLVEIAEELADLWEITYYHRELRPGVKETLETLKKRGYKLGVVSNTASLYSVFGVLERCGIRDYFSDVTLSSVTGYRKPHRDIFEIALRQVQSRAANSVYVGDTLSRDIIGAKQAGFGAAVQIRSFLSSQKDVGVDPKWQPDCVIQNMAELVEFLDRINPEGPASQRPL